MHGTTFVVYPGFELLDVSGPTSVFNGANRALGQRGRPPFYRLGLASALGGLIASSSGIAVETTAIAALRQGDTATVLVAGAEREPLLEAVSDAALRKAIPALAGTAERFGSVCTGGFLLASLGLLDGREVATHWDSSEPLTKAYPDVAVNPDALYVIDGRVWTSAGVTTGIDMALARSLTTSTRPSQAR